MKLKQRFKFLIYSIGLLSKAYSCAPFEYTRDIDEKVYQKLKIINPVFEPILADPTVRRNKQTGYFYVYTTEDNWGDDKGNRLMPILRSGSFGGGGHCI
ncbi:hypothetical protein [Sphingobacterium sp. MYb388]|uniref:hypothetical protein n=1 Tax=Sphingobacterium sp. MYb388 TaxID=2745437 RepID=UPI003096149F